MRKIPKGIFKLINSKLTDNAMLKKKNDKKTAKSTQNIHRQITTRTKKNNNRN